MKRRTTNQPASEVAADERADRLMDETLRELARPEAVDLKARVMAAIEGLPETTARTPRALLRTLPAMSRGRWWKPALALGGAAAIVLAVISLLIRPAGPAAPGRHDEGGVRVPRQEQQRASQEPAEPAALKPQRGEGATRDGLQQRARREPAGPPAPQLAATPAPFQEEAPGPHLPGAPSGNLGDPLTAMSGPPAIAIAPIAQAPILSAPPVSDIARPVTDFPADTSSPDTPVRTAGQSGGTRR